MCVTTVIMTRPYTLAHARIGRNPAAYCTCTTYVALSKVRSTIVFYPCMRDYSILYSTSLLLASRGKLRRRGSATLELGMAAAYKASDAPVHSRSTGFGVVITLFH